jgi:hypothetical protein
MTALRSERYLAGSREATCKFRIPGVCTGRGVVPCHIRDRHTGGAIKASDLSVADGCFDCHNVFDRRAMLPDGTLLSAADWHFYALRALQETLEARHALGLLKIPGGDPKPFSATPTPKRLPKDKRTKVRPSRGFPEESRPIPSRPMRRTSTVS